MKVKGYFTVATLAMAFVFLTPAAFADTFYNLTASGTEANGQTVDINAVLDLAPLGGGTYQLVGATGSIVDAYGTTDVITGVATVWVNPFNYDNLVSVPGIYSGLSSGGSYFDENGILFTTNEAGFDVGIAPDEYYNDGHYQYADTALNGSVNYTLGDWPYDTADLNNLTLTPVATPEPSSLFLLGTGLLGMAGLLFLKARKTSLQPSRVASF